MLVHNADSRISMALAKEFEVVFPDFSKENDMEHWVRHIYVKRQCISEFAREKYGNLTDDGYYELTVDGGGPHDWDEIYESKWDINKHGVYPFSDEEYHICPTIYEIQTFFRDKYSLHITVYSSSQESWMFRITRPHEDLKDGDYDEDYNSYEAALKGAIWKIIDLKKEGKF